MKKMDSNVCFLTKRCNSDYMTACRYNIYEYDYFIRILTVSDRDEKCNRQPTLMHLKVLNNRKHPIGVTMQQTQYMLFNVRRQLVIPFRIVLGTVE